MTTGNTIGIDPHRGTFTASALDPRGGEIGYAHLPNTRDVPPHRTSVRQRGASGRLDSHRIAVEAQVDHRVARAFKQAVPAPALRRDRSPGP